MLKPNVPMSLFLASLIAAMASLIGSAIVIYQHQHALEDTITEISAEEVGDEDNTESLWSGADESLLVILPNPALTPGDTLTTSKDKVCTPGYAADVRSVTTTQKRRVYAAYHLAYPQPAGTVQLDHLISLELGGSNSAKNLFPQANAAGHGYPAKDRLENRLHALVCDGRLDLKEAQSKIASNWQSLYREVFGVYP